MKTMNLRQMKKLKKVSLVVFIMIVLTNIANSQSYKQLSLYSTGKSGIIEYVSSNGDGRGILGLGTTTPSAIFHISNTIGLHNKPLLKLESNNGLAKEGLISLMGRMLVTGTLDSVKYSINQSGSSLINYFEGPIYSMAPIYATSEINCSTGLVFSSAISSIGIYNRTDGLPFTYSPPPGLGLAVSTPLKINYTGITVSDLMECNTILIHQNASVGNVLVSDAEGNGLWTDPSKFNDKDWFESMKSKSIDPPGPPALATTLYVNPQYKKVGIGTDKPQSELAVNGKVTAKEFEATLDGFPDYVFNSDYKLRSLQDLESYIRTNKHLPEFPSEKEVVENGLKLGEMNSLLVKKVEELSLYIISMQKEIDELKADRTKK